VAQASLTDRQLDTEVRKPADAARYRVEQEAQAAKMAVIAEAEAERARRAALAEAVKLEGDADASAIVAKGSAEAEAMARRAQSFKEYNDAARLQMVVEIMPQVAAQLAAPMGAIDQLTVISTDGAGALPKQVTSNMTQLQQLLKDTLGIDIAAMINERSGTSAPQGPGA
jgi:flotillin